MHLWCTRKIQLCILAAVLLGLFGPGCWTAMRDVGQEKATGLGVIAGGLLEILLSPLSWITAVVVFALLFGASCLGNKGLRVFLFWIPSFAISILGCGVLALAAFLWVASASIVIQI
jgi:hypothetical protein